MCFFALRASFAPHISPERQSNGTAIIDALDITGQ